MKKIIMIIAILIIVGCDNNKVTNEYKIYEKYIDMDRCPFSDTAR